jgi:hypothetical protein
VDAKAVSRVMRRVLSSPLTFAALGPVGRIESYAAIAARLH